MPTPAQIAAEPLHGIPRAPAMPGCGPSKSRFLTEEPNFSRCPNVYLIDNPVLIVVWPEPVAFGEKPEIRVEPSKTRSDEPESPSIRQGAVPLNRNHPSEIAIRLAVRAECAAVAELIRVAFEEYRGRLKPESGALGETAETVAAAFADHTVIVAETGGRLVGCLLATRQGEDLHLGRFAVHPDFRRRGVASRLLAEAERHARATGAVALALGLRIVLPDNFRYFAARGFREVGREAHPGFDRPTSINMAKRL
jgi:GNAT superfamily N-acetyltransferase